MALKEILARFGFEVDDKGLKDGEKRAEGFASKIKGALAVYGASEVIGGIRAFFSEMTTLEGQINDQAESLGLSAREFQQWGYAASQSGASAEVVTGAMLKMQRAAVDARGKFKDLGVEVEDGAGNMRPTSELFRDVGLAIGAMSNEAERTASIVDIFGKSGTKLQATFAGGAEGLDAMMQRFDDLGGGVGQDALTIIGDASDRSADLGLAVTGLKARLAVALFPAFTEMVTKGAKVVAAFGKAAESSNLFKAAVVVLGAAGARAGLQMLRPFLPFVATVAAAVIILDELITTFEGGDSVITRFVDRIFGVGATKGVVDGLKENFSSLFRELEKAPTIGGKIENAFSLIGADLVKFFAEDVGAAIDLWISRNPEIADAAEALANDLLAPFDAIADMPGKVEAWVRDIVAKIAGLAGELRAAATSAGQAVVDGFMEAIGLGGDKVAVAAGKMGARAIAGVRGPAGIDARSPSRKGAKAGGDLVGGFLGRLQDAIPRVELVGAALGRASIPVVPQVSRSVLQQNTIAINQYGVRDPRGASRAGVLDGLGDSRRALLGAVG